MNVIPTTHTYTHTHTLSLRNVFLVLFNTHTHTHTHTHATPSGASLNHYLEAAWRDGRAPFDPKELMPTEQLRHANPNEVGRGGKLEGAVGVGRGGKLEGAVGLRRGGKQQLSAADRSREGCVWCEQARRPGSMFAPE